MNEKNKKLVAEMIAHVESNSRWDAYSAPGTISEKEHTITIGAYQFGGGSNEARDLLRLIKKDYPNVFTQYDTCGIAGTLSTDWYSTHFNPSAAQKKAIIAMISTKEGIATQVKYFCDIELPAYLKRAEEFGIKTQKCQALWVEIQHLGGLNPTKRIFGRIKSETVDEVDRSLKLDQADTSNSNQVGDWIYYKDRHSYCLDFVRKYIVEDEEGSEVSVAGCTAKKYVEKALSYNGYREKNHSSANMESFTSDAGSGNFQKFQPLCNAGNGDQWCQYFVNGVAVEACGSIKEAQRMMCDTTGRGYMTGYTPEGASYFKSAGRWYTTPQYGDIVYFYSTSMGRICHVGIVISVNTSKKTFQTVEGNTNSDGFTTNGGCVAKHEYSYASIGGSNRVNGFGRPKYAESDGYILKKGDNNDKVKELQEQLQLCGFANCSSYGNGNFADGSFGDVTDKYVRFMQEAAGIEVDGHYGEQSQKALATYVKAAKASKFDVTVDEFLANAKKVAQDNKKNGFKYGNSSCLPSVYGKEKLTSCDRYVNQVLFASGLKDCGNRAVGEVEKFVQSKGATKITDINEVQAGDIIIFKGHIFIVGKKIDDKTWERYDSGSSERITSDMPFKEGIDGFLYAWRMPFKKIEEPKQTKPVETAQKATEKTDIKLFNFSVRAFKYGDNNTSVRLCQKLLKANGFKGSDGKDLKMDGDAGLNTVFAINAYQTARRKAGVELGDNGKNDGACGQKMWKDLLGL